MSINIVGRVVLHKVFGEGKIISITNDRVKIFFPMPVGEKNFLYPDAFDKFLEPIDEDFKLYINEIVGEVKKVAKEREEKKLAQKRIEEKERAAKIVASKKNKHKKKEISRNSSNGFFANIAFKCSFCNGGKEENKIGFKGICDDELIYNNIKKKRKSWCNSQECQCFKYYNKEITRQELEKNYHDNSLICYESQMLKNWKAFAGIVQNGSRKGQHMKFQKIQENSLCVLTTRTSEMNESDRCIFAVFLIDDFFKGDQIKEGYVSTKSKYKISLSIEEAKKILFWNYYTGTNNTNRITWSSGLHRYFENKIAAQILKDIAIVKKNTEDEELANDFLKYYCKKNNIDIDKIPEPNGALISD